VVTADVWARTTTGDVDELPTRTLHPTAADAVVYEFTVTHPTVWTRPWTGMVPWRPTEEPMFEYACHEGNYGMTNLLTLSRTAGGDVSLVR
jgi:hypothetical protein